MANEGFFNSIIFKIILKITKFSNIAKRSKFLVNNKKILIVRLLDGPDKDRNYYIITKDLIKNFSNMEKS